MTDQRALLEHAEDVLEGKVALGSSGPRTAALLARCAFEEWLDEQSASWAPTDYPFPSTRSKLVVLEALGDPEIGAQARWVWEALSRNVHHHAYELQPSVAEVRHLVEQVRGLAGLALSNLRYAVDPGADAYEHSHSRSLRSPTATP